MNQREPFPEPEAQIEIVPRFRLQWEPAQDCFVLLYPEGMITLNASAAEILKHCDGSCTEERIIAALSEKFPGADLASDVREFLEEAYAAGWIRPRQT